MQTKTHSLIESITNIVVGLTINVIAQSLIFPLFGIHIPITHNLGIAICFTFISIVRSYCIRRWFTGRTEKKCTSCDLYEERLRRSDQVTAVQLLINVNYMKSNAGLQKGIRRLHKKIKRLEAQLNGQRKN